VIEQHSIVHLSAAGISVVVDLTDVVPTVIHWGSALGDGALDAMPALVERPLPPGGLDVLAPLSLVPEHGSGFLGRPGLEGRRADGTGWSPRFTKVITSSAATAETNQLIRTVEDPVAGLRLTTTLRLEPSGVLRTQATVTNIAATTYALDALRLSLPLPGHANETITFAGRHTLEFQVVREPWPSGTRIVETRSGRTSHDRAPVAFAGSDGFTEQSGDVWGIHVGWSGNASISFDGHADGRRHVQAGELLHPGEIVLGSGESYTTPWVYAAASDRGLHAVSQAFHRYLRARPSHPKRPRPITLNTWEAVYFDHDLAKLSALAAAAAEVGIERFVLDDGWFHARRDDNAGLGDWWVDPDVWPDGLGPLIKHVTSLGLEFGLWVEPEMVNPDSDLYRAHPDWVLTDDGYEPILGRHQLALDLVNPNVADYLFGHLDGLLRDNDISYLKWDMNRELVHASHDGRAAAHLQTLALYALLRRLGERHPTVEIESCCSGGGRIDFGILEHTRRVWASDCNDPLDRQNIQRGLSMFLVPELIGSHVGPSPAHNTGRSSTVAFRAVTALFGHMGVEWNILESSAEDRAVLAEVITLHKANRALLHSGDSRRFDHPNPTVVAHGVVSLDRAEALVSFAQMSSPRSLAVEPLRLPGLDPDRRYRVALAPAPVVHLGAARWQPGWVTDGLVATGRHLEVIGLQPPVMRPETALLIHIVAVEVD
jgi:alpha-galactosidase